MTKSKGGKKPYKQQHKENEKPKADNEKKSAPAVPNGNEKDSDLLKEILNLGGSKDDLKLLESIDDNDSEEFQTDSTAAQVRI